MKRNNNELSQLIDVCSTTNKYHFTQISSLCQSICRRHSNFFQLIKEAFSSFNANFCIVQEIQHRYQNVENLLKLLIHCFAKLASR